LKELLSEDLVAENAKLKARIDELESRYDEAVMNILGSEDHFGMADCLDSYYTPCFIDFVQKLEAEQGK